MARSTRRRSADKDDPIYKGGFVISSHRVRTKESDDTQASKADSDKEKLKKED